MFNEEQRIDNLVKTACDYAEKIRKLKQENYELKQRVAEFEEPKKKRKFRAMTRQEFCKKWQKRHLYCKSNAGYCCPLYSDLKCFKNSMEKPCKINGKYKLIEVKEKGE